MTMGQTGQTGTILTHDVKIPSGETTLEGELTVPVGATGVVLFAHGSGSSRHSPRNQFVARTIRQAGVGTLLFDLRTREQAAVAIRTPHPSTDIGSLAECTGATTTWSR